MRALCRELGASERRLKRACAREIGMSAKTMARIVRVDAAIALWRAFRRAR